VHGFAEQRPDVRRCRDERAQRAGRRRVRHGPGHRAPGVRGVADPQRERAVEQLRLRAHPGHGARDGTVEHRPQPFACRVVPADRRRSPRLHDEHVARAAQARVRPLGDRARVGAHAERGRRAVLERRRRTRASGGRAVLASTSARAAVRAARPARCSPRSNRAAARRTPSTDTTRRAPGERGDGRHPVHLRDPAQALLGPEPQQRAVALQQAGVRIADGAPPAVGGSDLRGAPGERHGSGDVAAQAPHDAERDDGARLQVGVALPGRFGARRPSE
jgi:hypothetical protein